MNQSKNKGSLIEWFKTIKQKIFYKRFTKQSIKICEGVHGVSGENRKIIYLARKLLLFNKNDTWLQKAKRFL